jgi:hypothetical protein
MASLLSLNLIGSVARDNHIWHCCRSNMLYRNTL